MKICRFDDQKLGVVEDDFVIDVSAAWRVLPAQRYPYPHGDQLIAHLDEVRAAILEEKAGGRRIPLDAVKLLSPVANPSKIIGAPINYSDHLDESKRDQG